MTPTRWLLPVAAVLCVGAAPTVHADPAELDRPATVITSNIPCRRTNGPLYAFDTKKDTAFESMRPVQAGDDFAVQFPSEVTLKSVEVVTGWADGSERWSDAVLEGTNDGAAYTAIGELKDGMLKADPRVKVTAIRLRATADTSGPVAITTLKLSTDKKLPAYRVGLRVTTDSTGAPELDDWIKQAAGIAAHWYPGICAQIPTKDFQAPYTVKLVVRKMNGVAYTQGPEIHFSSDYVRTHRDDLGMIVHELTHLIQAYRGPREGWVTEGIADYIRHHYYEPTARWPKPDPEKAKYSDSYKTTADFFIWVEKQYKKPLVVNLNTALRSGTYSRDVFTKTTGKNVEDLWAKYIDTVKKS